MRLPYMMRFRDFRLRSLRAQSVLLAALFCGGCVKLSGGILSFSKPNDFLRTEFAVAGSEIADGTSSLLVGLQLKNSDNLPVGAYKPEFRIASGAGVNSSGCTTSDANGISACVLRSTVPGEKVLELTNAKVGLKQTVLFTAPVGAKTGKIVAGASTSLSTAQGAKLMASVGDSVFGLSRTTQGGYQVRFNVHGAAVPR